MYTRAVYQEYKKQYNNSTTFVIEPNPDPRVKNGWLLKHENGEGRGVFAGPNMSSRWLRIRKLVNTAVNANSGNIQV